MLKLSEFGRVRVEKTDIDTALEGHRPDLRSIAEVPVPTF